MYCDRCEETTVKRNDLELSNVNADYQSLKAIAQWLNSVPTLI